MADTQLLRIQYVADTAGLQQSKTAAEQAQRATDALRDSAKKAGQEGVAGQNQFRGSIAAVRVEMEKQRALVELTNRNDTKLLNERIAKYKQLKAEVDKFNASLRQSNEAIKENKSSVDKYNSALNSAVGLVTAVFSAAVIRQVVNTSLEMATLAGNVEGVSRAFNRLPNSTLLLDSLRRGTHGAVTDLQLMQKALQANNFQIPLENLGILFEFAATKAQQTGQEVNHLVDYIVSGIGYRSIKRLDDLGFTANRVKEALGGISLQAASTAQVMQAVTQLMNEDLNKTGGFAETSATKVEKLKVAWNDLQVEIAKTATKKGGLVDWFNDIVEEARLTVIAQREGTRGVILEGINKQATADAKAFVDSIAGQDVSQRIESVQQQLNSLQQTIGRYNDMIAAAKKEAALGDNFGFPSFRKNTEGVKAWSQAVQQYGNRAHDIFTTQIDDAKKQLAATQNNKRILEQTIIVLKEYFATLKKSPDESVESLGLIEAKLAQIEETSDKIKTAKSVGEIAKLNNELSKLQGELADLKAFGTTKQFLEVEGRIKLVPVVDPKGFEQKLKQQPIFREGVTIPAKIGFTTGTRSAANSGAGGVQGSLNEQIDRQIQDATKNIPPINVPITVTPMTEWEVIGQEFSNQWQGVLGQGLSDTGNFLTAVVQAEADSYDARIAELKNFYDEQLTLAGNNENQKDRIRLKAQKEELKLRREAFEADKRAKKSQAAINGAVGITNAFATLPYPAAIVASALIVASTAAQIAAIDKEKPRFRKGKVNIEGPGTTTSDSIDAKISRGESVINASSTARSMKLLEGINSGRIDDRILRRLHPSKTNVRVIGMDDRRIVAAINKQRYPDYRRIGSDLYEVKKSDDGFSERIRRKSLSK